MVFSPVGLRFIGLLVIRLCFGFVFVGGLLFVLVVWVCCFGG